MLDVQSLNRAELLAFIESDDFQRMAVLPISRHRALSQAANPRAKDGDVLLLRASSQGRMVGYLGILPDTFRTLNGMREPIYWMSCIWTDPAMRGQGIAEKLVREALRVTDGRLLGTEFTAAARKLYDKTGAFAPLATLKGIRLYRRLALGPLLGSRLPRWKPLLTFADRVVNALADVRWRFGARGLPPGISLVFSRSLGEKATLWVDAHNKDELFARSACELRWILNNPWLLTAPMPDRDSRRYHFSAHCRQFESGLIEIWKEEELLAVVLYTLREGHFQLPYAYFGEPATDAVTKTLEYCWLLWGVHTATLYHPLLAGARFSGTLRKKAFQREYIMGCASLPFLPPPPFRIQPGDGDAAFT